MSQAHRRAVALGVTGALALALAVFAFLSVGTAQTAHAETRGLQNLSCTIAPSPFQLNTPETLTCTFTFNGSAHTFVANFQVSTTTPPLGLQISSCTLDGNKFSAGPCP
ncbi:MAG: hypothetical protein ACYDEB_07590 [Dehalococcoidia bacterium]